MSKPQPAYFYAYGCNKPMCKRIPDDFDIESKVVEVMGYDGMMHALDGLRYDHKVRLFFRFKTMKEMQKADGELGDSFKYRSRMFMINARGECYPDEDGYWTLIITGEGQDKPLYPRP
jgi:hypothetical protein